MNLKGGTAKTVTAINTAAILARDYDATVLLVDADSQANLTEFVSRGLPDGVTPGGLPDLLRGMQAMPLPTKLPGVSILHADETLMELDVTAAGSGAADPMALADWLADHAEDYDYCVIDCPPAFSAAAMAALIAADEVVVPMKLDAFGIRGMANLLEQVRNMRRVNGGLEVAGVLPTMCYVSPTQKQAEESLRQSLHGIGLRCFHHIRRSIRVDDLTFEQRALIYGSPKSAAARDYRIFCGELYGRPAEVRDGGVLHGV